MVNTPRQVTWPLILQIRVGGWANNLHKCVDYAFQDSRVPLLGLINILSACHEEEVRLNQKLLPWRVSIT